MERPQRLAVIGCADLALPQELQSLPTGPEVRAFSSLYGDTEALQRWQPEVAFVGIDDDGAETAGALRVLRGILPGMAIVLVGRAAVETTVAPVAQRLGAQVLLRPGRPGDVAEVLAQALAGSAQPRAEAFVDLVRGIADEVNNPLMYISGYLQLLRAGLDAERDRDRHSQLQAALSGVQRIQATLARIHLLARAEHGARLEHRIDLVAAMQAAMDRLPDAVRTPIEIGSLPQLWIRGEPELLTAALDAFVRVAGEFADHGDTVGIQLDTHGQAARARLRIQSRGLQAWRLPRTFEPYYLNRVFRGTAQGLGLFLTQTVLHAHRGEAIARRLGDDVLAIDLLVPLGE